MSPKVSVIIPVYNAAQYLEKCLDSILGQTLPVEALEVVCVDDGSTDASPEILSRYAAAHANMRTLRQQNGGPSLARNAALDIATGEYVLFVDSDDWLLRPDVIETLYAQAVELRLDELFFNAEVSYEDDETHAQNRRFDRLYVRSKGYPEVLDGPAMFELLCRNGDYVCSVWSRLYRRAFLEENRLRFYPGIIHQDEVFSLECMSLEKRTGYRDLACYGRHVHPGSIMTSSRLSFSVWCYLTGALALRQFARERLRGADARFMKRFRWRVRVLVRMATEQYLRLPPEERGAVLEGEKGAVRWRMRRMLWGGMLRRRLREVRRGK